MTVAFPKKAMPVALAVLAFAMAGVARWRFVVGDGYWALLVFAWFTFGGAVFLYSSRCSVLHVRDGMLLSSGVAVPLASIRAARIVRLWLDGGPSRILELQLSEAPNLSWHIRLVNRFFSMWRYRWYCNQIGYTPPPDPYYLIDLPETDLSDEDIVNALRSP
jgi:hypothetical protein